MVGRDAEGASRWAGPRSAPQSHRVAANRRHCTGKGRFNSVTLAGC